MIAKYCEYQKVQPQFILAKEGPEQPVYKKGEFYLIVEKKHLMTLVPKNRTGWITLQNPPKLNKDPSF